MPLLTRGNTKLGSRIWHFNLPAGESCPGASTWCARHCYAKHGNYRFANIRQRYAANMAMPIGELRRQLDAELSTLPSRAVVRIHTSGDFHSYGYIAMWCLLAKAHPIIPFYAYTRSWRVPELVTALDEFRALPNVTLWASTDDTTGPAPDGWPEATIGFRPGYASCPEQTGRRLDCSDCGLCWHHHLRADARLAFRSH